MTSQLSKKLSSGQDMPLIGLGTWQAPPGEVGAAVGAAIKAGYRHIDCAAIYGNEAEVGTEFAAAFKAGIVKRSELFVTSKLWNSEHAPEHVRQAVQNTLRSLQLEYLDLYLIHWPQQFEHTEDKINQIPRNEDGSVRYAHVPLINTWRAMEALVEEGLVRGIGVSNFNSKQLAALSEQAKIAPACNQVESHPFFAQEPLLQACQSLGVTMTAYSPLGNGATIDGHTVHAHPELARIGAKHGVYSASQVAIAYQVKRGVPTFPKSVKEARIVQNLAAGALAALLDDEDMTALRSLDASHRVGYGGPRVEREGRTEPRDLLHPDYPWNADGSERSSSA
jgi:alcohol dehydrogenase (NADP+)